MRSRVMLFAVSCVIALVPGAISISPEMVSRLVRAGGYFFVLLLAVLFLTTIWRGRDHGALRARWSRGDWLLVAASVGVALVWQLHAAHGLKSHWSEEESSLTGMTMHFTREVFIPAGFDDVTGALIFSGGSVPGGPLTFPFLLSVVHDLFGYRVGNVFLLNGVLSLALLVVSCRIVRKAGGGVAAAGLVLILLGGVQVLAAAATGGGAGVFNLYLLGVVVLLGIEFNARPAERTLDALVVGGVFLAYTFQNPIFVVGGVVVLVVATYFGSRRVTVSWAVVVAPLLLCPLWLRPMLTRTVPAVADSIVTVAGSLGQVTNMITGFDGSAHGSPVLALAGIVSLVVLLVRWPRWRRVTGDSSMIIPLVVVGAAVMGVGVGFATNRSAADESAAARAALPVLWSFALVSALAVRWISRPGWRRALSAGAAAWWILFALPATSREGTLDISGRDRELGWMRDFAREHRGEGVMIAAPSAYPLILDRRASTSIAALVNHPEAIRLRRGAGSSRELFVFQQLDLDPLTGERRVDEGSKLSSECQLETLEERRYEPLVTIRLSRVIGMEPQVQDRNDGARIPAATGAPTPAPSP